MTILPLVIEPDPRLHIKSEPIDNITEDVLTLLDDMLDTMYANNGIGLSAVQVGVHKRVIVVDVEWEAPRYSDNPDTDNSPKPGTPIKMINPEIIDASAETSVFNEGCLSFPDQYSDVTRPKRVKVKYLDEHGKEQTVDADELLATCIQHEIDHCDGVVFVDHISKLKRDMIIKKLKKAKKLGTLPKQKTEVSVEN